MRVAAAIAEHSAATVRPETEALQADAYQALAAAILESLPKKPSGRPAALQRAQRFVALGLRSDNWWCALLVVAYFEPDIVATLHEAVIQLITVQRDDRVGTQFDFEHHE
ncbi:hypothetical protein Rhe02_09290 [Rhizocola hellebori]|uniref:Uncharacterized protein n=1 Tax=Rhizocola hellebori TaxID=1392758 RepID=A0A8J3VDZ7_9ACTN|nr:hypothetical protein [Rhizocola hellebori]GIH02862.1 hypothetical protein Rhe02_09290 [Rhizocola hellebori]